MKKDVTAVLTKGTTIRKDRSKKDKTLIDGKPTDKFVISVKPEGQSS